MKDLQKNIIIVLCLVALIIGFLIYKQKYPTKLTETSSSEVTDKTGQKLSDEQYLFSIRNNSTEEEKQRHYQFAVNIAQSSPVLKLAECKSTPLVWRVANNSQIKIQNDNNIDVVLTFNSTHSYAVSANSSKLIKAEFGNGPGLYGYGYKCTLPSGEVPGNGMVLVTP